MAFGNTGGSAEPRSTFPHCSHLDCTCVERLPKADPSLPITSQRWAVDFHLLSSLSPGIPPHKLFRNQPPLLLPSPGLVLVNSLYHVGFCFHVTPILANHSCLCPKTTAWNWPHCFHAFPLNVCHVLVFHALHEESKVSMWTHNWAAQRPS